jgi:hypothetical protein
MAPIPPRDRGDRDGYEHLLYMKGVSQYFFQPRIVLDKFHIKMLAGKAPR